MNSMLCDELDHALTSGPGLGSARTGRSLLRVSGPDALDFVHRICSQDVLGLSVGGAAGACFLTPKGKLSALAAVARAGESELWIDTAASSGAALYGYLDRFHFTERLTIEAEADGWVAATAFGAAVWRRAGFDAASSDGVCRASDAALRLLGLRRHGIEWVVAHGEAARVDEWWRECGFEQASASHAECLRIASGQLTVGHDVDDATLALEAPVDDHVSTSKGCYTGQEIVARIHTYGHVNRNVVALRIATDRAIEPGTPLCEPDDGDVVGRVTTSAACTSDTVLAVGYVPRDFAARGTELRLGERNGPIAQVVGFGPA